MFFSLVAKLHLNGARGDYLDDKDILKVLPVDKLYIEKLKETGIRDKEKENGLIEMLRSAYFFFFSTFPF